MRLLFELLCGSYYLLFGEFLRALDATLLHRSGLRPRRDLLRFGLGPLAGLRGEPPLPDRYPRNLSLDVFFGPALFSFWSDGGCFSLRLSLCGFSAFLGDWPLCDFRGDWFFRGPLFFDDSSKPDRHLLLYGIRNLFGDWPIHVY